MLKYLRNKQVSVDRSGLNELTVHGRLDDDLYGLTITATFSLDELEILSIDGAWHRYTTPECPRALLFLSEAVGQKLQPGFRDKIQKTVGRKGCRHYANLLLEMAHSAKKAALVIAYQQAKANNPELTMEDFINSQESGAPSVQIEKKAEPDRPAVQVAEPAKPIERKKIIRPSGNGLLIDMHMHTSPASPCSSIHVDDIIEEAKKIGLDGVVLTDHNYCWSREDLEDLRQKHGYLVLGANEVITEMGDVLVYGLDRNFKGVTRIADLRNQVLEAGGFMAAAHPFRGFLIVGAQQMGLTVEKAAEREMFKMVDALEVLNGKVTADENSFSARVAEALNLPGLAGSDAHEAGSVGCYATEFKAKITNEQDLVQALRNGDFQPVVPRN